jgi:hypothetical protein
VATAGEPEGGTLVSHEATNSAAMRIVAATDRRGHRLG